ncbi:hypothetical protein AB0H43_10795 [Hamadaea sp. NPDC050747]|uniref:hypothetical protein n=1 Tax=Hamadaea sp. NPDC050747 TaxID=3155789 RepID=UPI00340D01E5
MPLMDGAPPLYLLKVERYGFIDDGWPPWVKARLVDADGRTWHFHEKMPTLFTDDEPTEATPLPVICDSCRPLGIIRPSYALRRRFAHREGECRREPARNRRCRAHECLTCRIFDGGCCGRAFVVGR